MKALTVRQPWACLIACGQKTVEVRSWRTSYRGPLLITASARKHGGLPTGCAVCLVDLVDCRPITAADLKPACLDDALTSDYAWVLTTPRPLPPIPVRGKLSIWTPPPDLLASCGL